MMNENYVLIQDDTGGIAFFDKRGLLWADCRFDGDMYVVTFEVTDDSKSKEFFLYFHTSEAAFKMLERLKR